MFDRILKVLCAASFAFCAVAAEKVVIHCAGDSTMCERKDNKRAGWVQMLRPCVKSGVTVRNCAVGGESTKSFIASKKWSKLIAKVQKGDYVIIQFGHNDQKKKNPERYAAADGEFKDNLRKFVSEVREKGASPVLATSISRRAFGKNGKLTDYPNLREYANATIDIANEMNVPVVDLNTLTKDYLNEVGKEKSVELFYIFYDKKDNTHPTVKGGKAFAELFIQDVKKQNLEIAKLFK
ncbi:MAG: rhamnogalacturonan acetylesterase [Lentisphaeria bacterium]|nr:rhamnogalacturonan acetylesterase [Lentisphaeria bacterium]